MASEWPARWPGELASVLALAPHPDDELFCAGLLARAAAGGARVSVVCATGGGAGLIFGERAPRDEVIAVRAAELEASCAALGVASVEQLGFADAGLDDSASEAIAEAIARAAPDLIVSFAADGGYGHRDHVTLVALIAAALEPRSRPPRWLQRVFPAGEFAATVTAIRRRTPRLLVDGTDPQQGVRLDAVDWVVDSAATEARRRAAHAAHASQRWMLDDLAALFSLEEWYVEA